MSESNLPERTATHWSRQEDTHYHFYLILKFPAPAAQDSRQSLLFKDMHRFIPSRSPAQCRTHHQKRIKGQSLEDLLTLFFQENYTERLLGCEHLRFELTHFINKKYQQKTINQEQREMMVLSMEENIKKINFMRKESHNQSLTFQSLNSYMDQEKPDKATVKKKKVKGAMREEGAMMEEGAGEEKGGERGGEEERGEEGGGLRGERGGEFGHSEESVQIFDTLSMQPERQLIFFEESNSFLDAKSKRGENRSR